LHGSYGGPFLAGICDERRCRVKGQSLETKSPGFKNPRLLFSFRKTYLNFWRRPFQVSWYSLTENCWYRESGWVHVYFDLTSINNLVLSPTVFNKIILLALVAPITSRVRGHGFEVSLSGQKISKVVLCHQIKL